MQTEIETIYFDHTYQTNSFDILGKKTKRQHACLKFGYWCWKNALENPRMAIQYLIWKLKEKHA